MCFCYLRGFLQESIYKASQKRANPRFRIAAIYPSVNIQPLMKIPKLDIQHGARTHDLPHSRRARLPLYHRCGLTCIRLYNKKKTNGLKNCIYLQ